MVLERFLSHAGQMILGVSPDDLASDMDLKLMAIKDLSERLCLVSGEDAGQRGDSFKDFVSRELFVDGVREGTQKDGRVGFADYMILVGPDHTEVFDRLPSLHREPVLLSPALPLRFSAFPLHRAQICALYLDPRCDLDRRRYLVLAYWPCQFSYLRPRGPS